MTNAQLAAIATRVRRACPDARPTTAAVVRRLRRMGIEPTDEAIASVIAWLDGTAPTIGAAPKAAPKTSDPPAAPKAAAKKPAAKKAAAKKTPAQKG